MLGKLQWQKISLNISLLILSLSALLSSQVSLALEVSSHKPCQTIEFYSREGCPHCSAATDFFDRLQVKYPDLSIQKIDIHQSESTLKKFFSASNAFDIKRPGVPLIVACERFYIGFDKDETSGRAIEAMLFQDTATSESQPASSKESKGSAKDGIGESSKESAKEGIKEGANGKQISLPVIGELSVSDIGLPLFTIAVGLVDGFNPCAMWVLLFILSLVVNIKDRKKVILIAGTFVVVSGLVYFAFMAAWLNLFQVIGWSRSLQIGIAIVAFLVAAIHIKDFFAFKKGISLSIPDRFKPAIYKQSRKVIKHHNLLVSMSAVAVLAVMVNFIELLCTAGLPALYTQILVQQDLNNIAYYAYLALYNLAYIFDDGLMVMVAVVTLRHNKLQEQQGKWLKLLSGITILALAVLLLVEPAWLF